MGLVVIYEQPLWLMPLKMSCASLISMLDLVLTYSAETATVAVASYMVLGGSRMLYIYLPCIRVVVISMMVVLILLLVPFVSKNLVYPNLSIATVASFLMTTVAVIKS